MRWLSLYARAGEYDRLYARTGEHGDTARMRADIARAAIIGGRRTAPISFANVKHPWLS
jgi:hypothetical protein